MIGAFSGISARQAYGAGGGSSPGGNAAAGLFEFSDLTYQGSFRVQSFNGSTGSANMSYSVCGMCYDDSAGTLYMTGNVQYLDILETNIPTLSDGTVAAQLSDLNQSTLIQGHRFVLSDWPDDDNYAANGYNPRLGSLIVSGGTIYGGMYPFYDGTGLTKGFYYLSSKTLSSATISGLYQLGSVNPKALTKYMGTIPSEHQASFGGHTHFCGRNSGAVIGQSSYGPVFGAFTPSDIGVSTDLSLCAYYNPVSNALGWDDDDVWNAIAVAGGAVMPSGANCVMFFGANKQNGGLVSYGEANDTNGSPYANINDPYRLSKGYHEVQGLYSSYYWAYDVADLVAVYNGTTNPWSITPYAHGEINIPLETNRAGGLTVAYDSANKRIFIAEPDVDVISFSSLPAVHVYTHP